MILMVSQDEDRQWEVERKVESRYMPRRMDWTVCCTDAISMLAGRAWKWSMAMSTPFVI